jgi:hypothetical protein
MRLSQSNTRASLFSVGTPTVEIQIVASASGLVLDVQTDNVDTEGRGRRCHATAKLALDEAMRFEAVLQQAVDAAWGIDDALTERTDPRQTALWSKSTFSEPVRRRAAA